MNPKLQKTVREIERTKEKIAELQALLPELEKQKTDLENTEIVKAVRSACVAPGDLADFLASYRAELVKQPAPTAARTDYRETEAQTDDEA
ncbi:MAG: DUF4315 family protein [Clostridiales Family XIII bacterium]|nr:DUF4315 family protein [Clostridiales Family XIII bacterium]